MSYARHDFWDIVMFFHKPGWEMLGGFGSTTIRELKATMSGEGEPNPPPEVEAMGVKSQARIGETERGKRFQISIANSNISN
jgi:hypothetical protein